ncbi:response regulator [Sulfitobacter sp. F26204]|uniref:response regulator n=1 Tax=Sulfitobacter sp. F26204 TaxID=2996014 RepID=UPI00225DF3D3|nr:response regulator [Sulfitobacter sp. F26204]MCX7558037.1 response regulator [Sulfitobacter sp. F26204]
MGTNVTALSTLQPCQTCLIVEDSVFDREKLTRILKKSHESIRIVIASTLKSARRALEKGPMSLILLDHNLPDGLGADFALELAHNPDLATIPVIMVSDWPSAFMWEKASRAGVAYVLNKTEFDGRYVHTILNRQSP